MSPSVIAGFIMPLDVIWVFVCVFQGYFPVFVMYLKCIHAIYIKVLPDLLSDIKSNKLRLDKLVDLFIACVMMLSINIKESQSCRYCCGITNQLPTELEKK